MEVFTERNYGEKLDDHVSDLSKKIALMCEAKRVTVFELMKTIYNFMSECYTTGELLEKTRAIKVLTDSISQELLLDMEGLEP